MRMLPWLLLALLPTLAGCLADEQAPGDFTDLQDTCGKRPKETFYGGDHSKETIEYRFESDGPFTVRVPVVLSEDGATLQEWADSATDTATVEPVGTPRGQALEVSGDDGSTVIVCSVHGASDRGNGCCAETYLDGEWSTTPGEIRPQAIDVEVVEGQVTLYIEYEAESNWCGRDAHFNDASMDRGWHSVPGEDAAWCE